MFKIFNRNFVSLILISFLSFVVIYSSRFKIRKAEHGSATTWSGCSRAKPTAHTGSGMKCCVWLIAFVFLFICKVGYLSADEMEDIDPNTVYGRFVDENGKPVDEVRLRVLTEIVIVNGMLKPTIINLVSDTDGRFSFIAPKTEDFSITAYPKSLALSHWKVTKRGDIGDLVLKKGFQPKIRLLTPNGDPISGVNIRLNFEFSGSHLSILCEQPSDSQGYCTFQHVEAGKYTAVVVPSKKQNDKIADIPYVILGKSFTFSNEIHEVDLVAFETISATINFDSDIIIPDNANWGDLRTTPNYGSFFWAVPFKTGVKNIGKGVYAINGIPKNVPLCLSIAIKDSVFSCSVSTKKQERIIPGLLELGTFDKPFSIRVSSRKASSVKLSAKDEEGKAIDNFYAVGYYPNLSGYIDGSIIWGNDTMESNVRIKPERLKKRFLDPIELAVRYNFSRSFEMQSQVTFFWDHINKTAQISNIIPNEKVIIILYDKQGRQGHIETTLTEAESKEFVVVLENNQ